jgi:hypothetical protein
MARVVREPATLLVLVIGIAGCAGREPPPPIIPAEGVVLFDGEPLKQVEVRFVPLIEHGAQYIARGVTDDTGRFKLMCNGKEGACEGENLVLVCEVVPSRLQGENAQEELAKYFRDLGTRPPPRYSNLAESPLSAIVTTAQPTHVFHLTR